MTCKWYFRSICCFVNLFLLYFFCYSSRNLSSLAILSELYGSGSGDGAEDNVL